MTEQRRQRISETLAQIDALNGYDDPDIQRAVEAVRESTPGTVITMLEERGMFEAMLEKMCDRFGDRDLGAIRTREIVQIARDSVDETLGMEPLSRAASEFPKPLRDSSADVAALELVEQAVQGWRRGDASAQEALTETREALRRNRDFTH